VRERVYASFGDSVRFKSFATAFIPKVCLSSGCIDSDWVWMRVHASFGGKCIRKAFIAGINSSGGSGSGCVQAMGRSCQSFIKSYFCLSFLRMIEGRVDSANSLGLGHCLFSYVKACAQHTLVRTHMYTHTCTNARTHIQTYTSCTCRRLPLWLQYWLERGRVCQLCDQEVSCINDAILK